jgi:hypothetical protein
MVIFLIVIHIQISNVNSKEVNNWSVDVPLPLVIILHLHCFGMWGFFDFNQI